MFIADHKRDDALGSGQNPLRLDSLVRIVREIRHLPVLFRSQPVLELTSGLRRRRRRKPTVIEAQFACVLCDLLLHDSLRCARRNWWSTCWATSLVERISVLTNTSARR